MSEPASFIRVRNTTSEDFPAIEALSRKVYRDEEPWTANTLALHRHYFPEGQLVAEDTRTGDIVGMAATLIVNWEDYDRLDDYADMTAGSTFANHDPSGRTLYGAEVMADPDRRREGIGHALYEARRELCRRLGLARIRAGARIPGYAEHANRMSAAEYVHHVVNGELHDPTLSFQLGEGFHVLAVVPRYDHSDSESHGYAVLIEWLNPEAASPADYGRRDPRFVPRADHREI